MLKNLFRTSLLAAALATGLTAPSEAAPMKTTTFNGSWSCHDRGVDTPLANARVELLMRGSSWLPKWFPGNDTLISAKRTDDNGRYAFRIRTDATDTFYVRVVMRDGNVVLGHWLVPGASFNDTRGALNPNGEINFGDLTIHDRHCAAFQGHSVAYKEFVRDTGLRAPYGELSVLFAAPTAGVPFAHHTKIHWPSDYRPGSQAGGFEKARHEFAHTVRHGYDSSYAHWLTDVARFGYAQRHSLCKVTNAQFAFNEGWAEYWAGQVTAPPMCEGLDPQREDVEGFVAAKLHALADECYLSRRTMNEVLKANPGRIHTFAEFRAAARCNMNRVMVAGILADLHDHEGSAFGSINEARRTITMINGAIGRYRAERRVVTCLALPCPPLEVRRTLLDGQIDQLKLLRDEMRFQTQKSEMKRISEMNPRRMAQMIDSKRRDYRREAISMARETVAEALRAAREANAKKQAIAELKKLQGRPEQVVNATIGAAIQAAAQAAVGQPIVPASQPAPAATENAAPGQPAPAPAQAPAEKAAPKPPAPAPTPAAPSQSDLVVNRMFSVAGDCCDVNVELTNRGTADAPASKTEIVQEGQAPVLVDTPALAPGQTTTVTINCVYAGLGSFTARADAGGVVQEADETNNGGSLQMGTGGPDATGAIVYRCRYP